MERFLKAAARLGAVGGTARWAALIYHRGGTEFQSLTLGGICQFLIGVRYGREAERDIGGSAHQIAFGLRQLNDGDDIRSVAHFVLLILAAEAGFLENSPKVQLEFLQTVLGELRRKGVPDRYVVGSDTDRSDEELLSLYRDSADLLVAFLKARLKVSGDSRERELSA